MRPLRYLLCLLTRHAPMHTVVKRHTVEGMYPAIVCVCRH